MRSIFRALDETDSGYVSVCLLLNCLGKENTELISTEKMKKSDQSTRMNNNRGKKKEGNKGRENEEETGRGRGRGRGGVGEVGGGGGRRCIQGDWRDSKEEEDDREGKEGDNDSNDSNDNDNNYNQYDNSEEKAEEDNYDFESEEINGQSELGHFVLQAVGRFMFSLLIKGLYKSLKSTQWTGRSESAMLTWGEVRTFLIYRFLLFSLPSLSVQFLYFLFFY